MFETFLILHIISGIICLILGLISGLARKRKGLHTLTGEVYHWSYVGVFITAIVLSIMHWEASAYLFYIAIFSYSFAFIGYISRKRRWRNWLMIHIGGMLGSYIGIVTAVLVVNVSRIPLLNGLPTLTFWFLPTIIGTPIIATISKKYKKRSFSSKTV
ncbi:DUF2306 domain-containing protein [Bacillus sp. Marseille-Q3570]|uniref:DUF2306 domain-containing protein n=1 Tax=Bacillus sp. Marseille-Q3570 TaxID=2963522 RepID=UPI0021B731FB|nr:DUF2306 domain-containing protein [Bacillus sp. Marseille-Q3570]